MGVTLSLFNRFGSSDKKQGEVRLEARTKAKVIASVKRLHVLNTGIESWPGVEIGEQGPDCFDGCRDLELVGEMDRRAARFHLLGPLDCFVHGGSLTGERWIDAAE